MELETHCFTSVSFSYLSRARVLAETVRRHHPEWVLWLSINDREPPGFHFDAMQESFDHVLRLESLPIENVEGWIFRHDVVELCTAVKGFALEHILEQGAGRVVYLDPDIAVFAPLNEVLELLDSHSVVLTPHLVDPEETLSAISDNEISSLKHGVYNLGFLGVCNDSEGRRFARWWRERLAHFCYADTENGLFTDQRWCDLVPGFFDRVAVLRDPGYNVASWNLGQRPLTIEATGEIRARGCLPKFFHFTKVNSVGELMIERYSPDSIEPFELLSWYRRRLSANDPPNLPSDWWFYGTYANGKVIARPDRLLYRMRPDLRSAFPNPFETGEDSYLNWLEREGLR